MTRALVVDVDDTLYLERDYVKSGFNHVGLWAEREHGVENLSATAWSLFVQGVRQTTLTDAWVALGYPITDAILHAMVREYRQHHPSIALCTDSSQLLMLMKGRGPIGIITDGPAASQRRKCDALGLNELAHRIVVTEELGTSKPDRSVFEAASLGWNVRAPDIYYVADNPQKDFQGPLQLGWTCFRVRRPASLHETVPTPTGVVEIASLDDSALIDAIG